MPPADPAIRVTDPSALRALAHPVRGRLLGLLRLHGPSTATLLGARVGESGSSASYHLRELARYGFVREVPDRGTGRERWWEAAHRSTSWSSTDFSGDDLSVTDELHHRMVEARGRLLTAWLEQRGGLPAEWKGTGTFNDLALHLTPEQTERLTQELVDVLVRWRDEEGAAPDTPGTGIVQVLADVFPLPEPPT